MLGGTAAAFPGDEDRQLLRDLQGRRTSAVSSEVNRQPHTSATTSPTAAPAAPQPAAQQQQQVEVRRVRRQTSDSPVTSPDAVPTTTSTLTATSSTSVGRLNAVEQFRRDEAKRASVISHTSSLLSSDGTINVVTDSEDDDEQRALPPASSRSRQQLPSPSHKSTVATTTLTGNGVLPSPPAEPLPVNGVADSSLPPQRDVTFASNVSPLQPSKCWRQSVGGLVGWLIGRCVFFA